MQNICSKNLSGFAYGKLFFPPFTAAKKWKKVDIDMKHSQNPQLKKAFVDTGCIDINALIV